MTQRSNVTLIKEDSLANGRDDGGNAKRSSAFGGNDGIRFSFRGVRNVGEGWRSGGKMVLDIRTRKVGGGPSHLIKKPCIKMNKNKEHEERHTIWESPCSPRT